MKSGILDQRQDWTLAVDLETKQIFPDHDKVLTNLGLGMMVWSTRMRKIIVIELTVQLGKNDAGGPKKEKERNMMKSWQGVKTRVGKHGTFQWRSVTEDSSTVSVATVFCTGSDRETQENGSKKLGQATERSSCWIWLKRTNRSWNPIPDAQ